MAINIEERQALYAQASTVGADARELRHDYVRAVIQDDGQSIVSTYIDLEQKIEHGRRIAGAMRSLMEVDVHVDASMPEILQEELEAFDCLEAPEGR